MAFSKDGRVIKATSKNPDWDNRNFCDDIEGIFKCNCRVAHDCICAGIAEMHSRNIDDSIAYVTVSSGTGGAILLRLEHETIALRARFAHQIVDLKGQKCHCGQKGCLATFTDGIEQQKKVGTDLDQITDTDFWQKFSHALAVGLINISWMYPVERIVVGGGIFLNNPIVQNLTREYFSSLRKTGSHHHCEILLPMLGEEAPLYGASLISSDYGKAIRVIY